MEGLLLLVICLAIGLLFKQLKSIPDNTYLSLNTFVIYAALPALILEKIPAIPFETKVWMPILMPWLVFSLALLLFTLIGRLNNWCKATVGCLILTCGLGNTSFVGIPVMQMIWGEAGVQVAILTDQPGSFAALATVGILIASHFADNVDKQASPLKRVFKFPPFTAFLLAILVRIVEFDFPAPIFGVLSSLGSMVVPLALVSVGMQLSFKVERKDLNPLIVGLFYKLLLAPLIIYCFYILWLNETSLMAKGSVMEAAMGPMITASIIATHYRLNPKLVGMVVGFGIPISFLTLVFWYFLL